MAVLRLVGSVHAIAVDRPRPRIRQIAVPDLVGVFGQFDALELVLASVSKRQSSTLVACAENSAKLTPRPVHVAPSGKGRPSLTRKARAFVVALFSSVRASIGGPRV